MNSEQTGTGTFRRASSADPKNRVPSVPAVTMVEHSRIKSAFPCFFGVAPPDTTSYCSYAQRQRPT